MGARIFLKTSIFEALDQICANRVFSPIRIEIRVLAAISPFGRLTRKQKKVLSKRESIRREYSRKSRANRESIRANRPIKIGNESLKTVTSLT